MLLCWWMPPPDELHCPPPWIIKYGLPVRPYRAVPRRSASVHQFVLKPVLAAAILVFFIVNYRTVMYGRDMYVYVCAMMCLASGAVMGVLEKLGK